jgi:hypothetical protein
MRIGKLSTAAVTPRVNEAKTPHGMNSMIALPIATAMKLTIYTMGRYRDNFRILILEITAGS